jgi:peptidoglycan/LPS O-acetylase OafA/YrhL
MILNRLFALRPDETRRVFGLDVLRAIAILTVVDAHSGAALGPYLTSNLLHQFIPDGVEVFFVLSGFLIGGILIRLYERENEFGWREVQNFWTRRWFRTLPAYYLVLVGLIAFAALRGRATVTASGLPNKQVLASYFVFLQNFNHYIYDFFPETWSLAIEEWSYLLLPTLLMLVSVLTPKRWPRERVMLTVIVLVIMGSNLGRLVQAIRIPLNIPDPELGYRGIVLTRLDAIAYGVLAAWLKQYRPIFWHSRWTQTTGFWLGVSLTVLVALSSSILVLAYYVDWGIHPAYVFYKRSFYFLAIGMSMMLLVPRMDTWQTARGWVSRVVTHISLISYSMYLINLSVIMALIIGKIPTPSIGIAYGKLILFWLLTILLSTIMYRFFEKPMTRLRERFSRKEPNLTETSQPLPTHKNK